MSESESEAPQPVVKSSGPLKWPDWMMGGCAPDPETPMTQAEETGLGNARGTTGN